MSVRFKTIELDFIRLDLFEDYIIATVHEGVLMDIQKIEVLHEAYIPYYPNKKFGYIDNRVNDYTINLSPDLYNIRYQGMTGLAVVCYTELAYRNSLFEKSFYNWPFDSFQTLEEAILWIEELKEAD